jgi:hypothetical protein
MKVERENEFIPIVITLETEKEARDLWHILNCLPSESLINYIERNEIKGIDIFLLLHFFNHVYTPSNE